MKKVLYCATLILFLGACYAPLNNSGVSTNKEWLDVAAKKTDFDGKQYDSCYQFRLRFSVPEAADKLDLRAACVSACCWRSDKEEVTLDFNKTFERDLKYYGRADKYSPAKITLSVSHSNLLNTTAVKVSPRGAISRSGVVKLTRKTFEDPARLAQIENEARRLSARRNALLADQRIAQEEAALSGEDPAAQARARALVQRTDGTHIDRYFYNLDKTYKKKGYIYFISERMYVARQMQPHVYRVTCRAKVQSGLRAGSLKTRNVSCGAWRADLAEGKVAPLDGTARRIRALR